MASYKSTMRILIKHPGLPLLGLIIVACLAYWPGLNGPYVLDDGENILLNPSVALTEFTGDSILAALTGNDSGPLKRPFAAFSFALNHYFNAGFYPAFAFKATNLGIHLINSYLIYLLCLKLLRTPRLAPRLDDNQRRRAAAFTAALWALHPIQLTNILYVVQRMNSLSALFVLAGLILFVHGRALLGSTNARGIVFMAGGVLGGMTLGLASKENAALLPLFALVIEYCFFQFQAPDRRSQILLSVFYLTLAVLPVVSFAAWLMLHPDFILDSYTARHFSVFERVLTETRILWFYIGLILLPTGNRLGLFHDDIALSTGLFTPVTTLFAVVGILLAFGLGMARARQHPLVAFAILWFLAGHAIESGFLGLELAYEHRNYLPSYGVIFTVAYGLTVSARNKYLASPLMLAVILLTFSFATWNRASTWSDINSLAEYTVRSHPASPRANDFAARTSLGVNNDLTAAIRFTLNGLRSAPAEAGFHIDLQILLNTLGAKMENRINFSPEQQRLDMRIAGLDEDLQAIKTKDGIHLSHNSSSPEAISELLNTRPITVHGIFSLENMRRCILDPPRSCAWLHDMALSWFAAAAQNLRTTREYRAILAGNAAMLYASDGDVARALEYINQAADLLPERVSYRVAKAEYLIRLGRLDEAKAVIDLLAAEPLPADTAASTHEANIRKLRDLYNKAAKARRVDLPPPRQ
jgi:tetratricopeptide (TPR) repeat protein